MGYLWFFIIGALFFWLYRKQYGLEQTINELQLKLDDLEADLAKYIRQSGDTAGPQKQTESIKPETNTRAETVKKKSVVIEPKKEPLASSPRKAAPAKSGPVAPAQIIQKGESLKRFEENLSSRWMVWVGGLAIALGGGFLVKYSIDAGILSPGVRVSLGFIMGIALTIGGEILRQRRAKLEWLEGAPDYLPSAISAAGLFSAFAAIYASYALYELLPALVAFSGLALLSFTASAIAFYQGKFFAYLGLIGGIIVPLLVQTGSSNAWGLFPYLLVIIAASLWVSRQKLWIDVATSTLVLALLWVIIWIPTNWSMGDGTPIGLYLLLLGTLNSILLSGASPERLSDKTYKGMISRNGITFVSDLVMIAVIILLVSIVRLDHYNAVGLMLITIGILAQAYAVHKSPANDTGGVMAIFGVLFLFATWHVPDLMEFKNSLPAFDQLNTAWAPTSPPGLDKFLTSVIIFTGILAAVIFWRLPHLMRKNMWASMGNIIPTAMLIITYWRVADWGTSLSFAFVALILAMLLVVAVNRLIAEDKENNITPIAAYAAGATTMISLGVAMVLRDAWLSFALALQIVALAHIWRMTLVKGLRRLALVLAGIVLVRLFLNSSIFDYGYYGQPLPLINWLFYGYGLTAVFFAYAAHIFKTDEIEDRLMSVLKAGAIFLAIAFVSLEIRVLFGRGGSLLSYPTGLEAALQVVNWGAATTILFWYEVKNKDRLLGRVRRVMTMVSIFGLITGGAILNNVFFGSTMSATPILNLQLLQFFIPGVLYGLKAYIAHMAQKSRSIKIYGTMAFLLIWYWSTAEVYNYFHPYGTTSSSDWEWYSYSLVWLIYAVVLLISGLKLEQAKIRQAGLAVLGIVVLKVFLVDMNQLEGISRALSFIGLGGALIGLGYIYQKLNIKNLA